VQETLKDGRRSRLKEMCHAASLKQTSVGVEKVSSAEMIFPWCHWALEWLFCLWSVA
jgi:hypothetical protein